MKTIEDKLYSLNKLSSSELFKLKDTYRDMDCGLCDQCKTRYAIIERYIFHSENRRHSKVYEMADRFVSHYYGDDWK